MMLSACSKSYFELTLIELKVLWFLFLSVVGSVSRAWNSLKPWVFHHGVHPCKSRVHTVMLGTKLLCSFRYGHVLQHTLCEGVFCGTKSSRAQIGSYREIPIRNLLHHRKLLQLESTAWKGSSVFQACPEVESKVSICMDTDGSWICGDEEYSSSYRRI